MKVLMISGDRHMLEPGSVSHARLDLQRKQVEQLDVFVWPQVHSKWQIYQVARKNRYDVITSQDPFFRGLLAWKIARLTGAKLNIQVHTDLSAQPWWRHIMAQIVLRHADSIRVVSDKIKNDLIRMGVRVSIFVLPIYVDLSAYSSLAHTPHPKFTKTILWVGRFEEEKDPLYALTILKQVRDAGIDAGLVMVGDGSLLTKAKERATKENLPVEFVGWQNPASYVGMADVVISTSKHESYGVSVLEALAAQVPVVSPDIGVAREAGAIIAPKEEMGLAVARALEEGARGALKITPLSAEEWAKECRESWS